MHSRKPRLHQPRAPQLKSSKHQLQPLPQYLASSVSLQGVKYEDQFNRWNYCGPPIFDGPYFLGLERQPGCDRQGCQAQRSRQERDAVRIPGFLFSANVPNMSSILRYGGDLDIIKRLVAGGYPVVAEKGEYQRDINGKISWMGHYQFINGYNDDSQTILIQDTYLDGPNLHMPYDKFMEGWRSFDYVFVVVYPTDRESDVMSLLAPTPTRTGRPSMPSNWQPPTPRV